MTTWTAAADTVEEWSGTDYYVWPEGYVEYGYVLPQGPVPTTWAAITDTEEAWA